MFSVALIGADGAGKSAIARMLQDSFYFPTKCIYMGINIDSSNVMLPTSRLIRFLLMRFEKDPPEVKRLNVPVNDKRKNKHKWIRSLRAAVRVSLLVSEECFRQCVSWSYQLRGFIVLYDRHFALDFEPTQDEIGGKRLLLADRLHRWFLARFYPRPDLVIFLDAPPEVLFARKGEGTLSYLNARRQAFIQQGKKASNFIRVDATRPIEQVYRDVSKYVDRFYEKRNGKTV